MKLIGIAAAAAALALPSLAVAEDATYDETQNWLAAWGQTQKDMTDPSETAGTYVNSAGNAAANAAVEAASTILSQSVKGSVADDLLAKGIAEVRAKLN